MNVDELLNRLQGVRRSGRGWSALCPAHEDRNASLSVAQIEGKLLLHCHAGCPTERIVSRLGLRLTDLFDNDGQGARTRSYQKPAAPQPNPSVQLGQRRRATVGPASAPSGPLSGPVGPLDWLAVYCGVPRSFLDSLPISLSPDGTQICFTFTGQRSQKRREIASKSFHWTPAGCPVPPLWPLPDQLLPEHIWLVEGETDCIVVRHVGLEAYALTRGCDGMLTAEQAAALCSRGVRRATIIFDADDAGRNGANRLAPILTAAALKVDVVDLAMTGLLDPLAGLKDLRDAWRARPEQDRDAFRRALESAAVSQEAGIKPDERLAALSTNVPFRTALELQAESPAEPRWIWEGFLAQGAITLLAGFPKAGKSTLLFGLLAAIEAGRPFLDRAAGPDRAVLLTEERRGTAIEKVCRWGLQDGVSILLRGDARALEWPDLVRSAVARARETEASLLCVDTFAQWAGLLAECENDAGAMLKALEPLHWAAEQDLAVLLAAHQRKAPGEHGQAVRGSSALIGGVDIVMELNRSAGIGPSQRLISTISRFEGAPDKMLVELGDDGFRSLGQPEEAIVEAERQRILECVADTSGITTLEVAEAAQVSRSTAYRRLTELQARGDVSRSGGGKSFDPFRWSTLG